MTTWKLLLPLALATVLSCAQAAERIKGRLQFIPQIAGTVRAVASVHRVGDADARFSIPVHASTPYEFSRQVPDDLREESLEIVIEVIEPAGYAPMIARHKRMPRQSFSEIITLRRRADAYSVLIESAPLIGNKAKAQQTFGHLVENIAETPGQKFEAVRAHARWAAIAIGPEQSEQIMANGYDVGLLQALGPRRQLTYWRERLDAQLEAVQFNKLRMPMDQFGHIVAADAGKLEAWQLLLKQYQGLHPDFKTAVDASDAQAIKSQLEALEESLVLKR